MYKSKLLNLNFEVIFGSLNSKVMDIFKMFRMLSCSNLKRKKNIICLFLLVFYLAILIFNENFICIRATCFDTSR